MARMKRVRREGEALAFAGTTAQQAKECRRPPFGKKTFKIPFTATGKKWVRFAAWDVATNGAFVQPIWLNAPKTTN